ncbi:MAG: YigZ family protein [Tissierellia bacterium]|nr:YigZ family protein [Tissierellia bacterium]
MIGYRSSQSKEEFVYEIKKSVFLAESKMVFSVDEAETFVEKIRQKHPKATHHCYAYSLTDQGLKQKAEDDGEPSGTAGLPILRAITMNELENMVLVVTRYFGGIKLGAGGLTRAYMAAATGCIESSGIHIFREYTDLHCKMSYELYNIVLDYIRRRDLEVVNTDFGENVLVSLRIPTENIEKTSTDLTDLSSGTMELTEGKKMFQ